MRRVLIAVWLMACVCACASTSTTPDNAAALRDIAARRSGSEVVIQGPVTNVFAVESGPSGRHAVFMVTLRNDGQSVPVLVADNISIAQAAPVRRGDSVVVKGELAFNGLGPVVHWTHRDPRLRHAPGFVEVGGKVYE